MLQGAPRKEWPIPPGRNLRPASKICSLQFLQNNMKSLVRFKPPILDQFFVRSDLQIAPPPCLLIDTAVVRAHWRFSCLLKVHNWSFFLDPCSEIQSLKLASHQKEINRQAEIKNKMLSHQEESPLFLRAVWMSLAFFLAFHFGVKPALLFDADNYCSRFRLSPFFPLFSATPCTFSSETLYFFESEEKWRGKYLHAADHAKRKKNTRKNK